jgi:hypothetical protein
MGFLQNLRPSFLDGLGQKVRRGFEKGLEIFGKAKGLFETGKAIYNGAQAIMPYINDAAAFIPYLL